MARAPRLARPRTRRGGRRERARWRWFAYACARGGAATQEGPAPPPPSPAPRRRLPTRLAAGQVPVRAATAAPSAGRAPRVGARRPLPPAHASAGCAAAAANTPRPRLPRLPLRVALASFALPAPHVGDRTPFRAAVSSPSPRRGRGARRWHGSPRRAAPPCAPAAREWPSGACSRRLRRGLPLPARPTPYPVPPPACPRLPAAARSRTTRAPRRPPCSAQARAPRDAAPSGPAAARRGPCPWPWGRRARGPVGNRRSPSAWP
mmetsp:Transcript_42652/g.105090  ORF Transcript_42652/g.105090 Transcript_42652/m.105090 type:complete len:263 (-) Transcript_42652:429-1217(-)